MTDGSASLLLGQATTGTNAALVTFLIYMLAVFGLAGLSSRLLQKKNFLSEYFLGSRSLGVWAFALTFAATSASGGSFTGFPSKIYSHGWVLSLWIASYMVVPICTMGLLGKRINQVARISGAITVPDVIRERFGSALFGLLATGLIVFFMSFNLVAQFKAGSLILKTLLDGVSLFEQTSLSLGTAVGDIDFLSAVDPRYLLCLLTFGVAVIVYTTYGGFHAVVWTDVMQGIVMVCGVMLMLPLALYQVGGLEHATQKLSRMTPPRPGTATLRVDSPSSENVVIKPGTWLATDDEAVRVFRVTSGAVIPAGDAAVPDVAVLEITTPEEIETIGAAHAEEIAAATVRITDVSLADYAYGTEEIGVYVTGPGPDPSRSSGFLPFSLAFSFFFMWAISGAGQPSSMVRLMAFNSARTLRRSIFTVAIYYTLIYFPLVIIFCCARVLMPGMDSESDRIMPAIAVFLTENIGYGWLAGLLVAAPFAAVMSTVDSFLLMISSGLVRDIYQRNLNPDVAEKNIKRLSYLATLLVGTGAMLGAVNPPQFLQDIIVYTGSGLAASFLAPMVFALYWPRANTTGAVSGMLAGFGAHLGMYVAGRFTNGSFFKPYQPYDIDPILVGLVVSFVTVFVATLATPPPPDGLVRKYFHKS